MRLLSTAASPFGRKVKLTAALKGVRDQITVEETDTRGQGKTTLSAANPLGKIPVLILADGHTFYDSKVICEYLDSLTPSPVLFPPSGLPRFTCLTRAALADGIAEAALLIVYESRYRTPDMHVAEWIARQQSKIDAGLAALETAPPTWTSHPDYGHVTLACALGYLDLRFAGAWRPSHPGLVAWLDTFATAVPAFEATRVAA